MFLKNQQNKFHVYYTPEVDIDGFRCCDQFAKLIRQTGSKKQYTRTHEYCCGHGAIGFKILESNLTQHLVLSDKYIPAIECCNLSVSENQLHDQVCVYPVESLTQMPKHEKWDLFVANPPWRPEIKPGPELDPHLERKMFDVGWKVHQDMFQNIGQHLLPGADIYLYEDIRFSNKNTWKPFYESAGLNFVAVYEKFGGYDTGYVLHLHYK